MGFNPIFFFFFSVFLILFLQTSSSSSSEKLCSETQSFSLLQFKSLFSIDASASSSSSCNISSTDVVSKIQTWINGTDCCSWSGVKCDHFTGHVVELDLSCSQINGTLHENTSLFNLSHLQVLNLAHNDFHGSKFSSLFGEFKNLTYLNLSTSGFSGELPDSVGNMVTNLKTLDISNCRFNGSIPASVGDELKNITVLNLSFNNFSGELPSSILNLQQLVHLDFSHNNLTGLIPGVIASLSSLSFLDFSDNQLKGDIPPWLNALPSLQSLDLSKNKLTGFIGDFKSKSLEIVVMSNNRFNGPIPRSVFELSNLTCLELQWNNLSGSVEMEKITKLQNLKSLDLSHNQLSIISKPMSLLMPMPKLESLSLASCNLSEFPSFLRTTKSLILLDLSNNKIHGEIPKWLNGVGNDSLLFLNLTKNYITRVDLTPWRHLGTIDLRSNRLTGPVPMLPPATTYFSISGNQMSGEIPKFICNMSLFRILDLSINNLTGEIPKCLGNFSNRLTVLDLRMNQFHGPIPTTFVEGNILRNLDLDGNRLQGPIPRSLAVCHKLEVLDLGNNMIKDTFPYWLETLPALQVLVLRSNKLYGSISPPKTNNSFPRLRIFDVSNNHFSGPLPSRYIENFKSMKAVDHGKSEVQYMGEKYCQDTIIVTMKGFQTQLLRILTVFTTIDLSNNKFNGEIPQVIGTLYSLRQLNVSNNELSGHIPTSLGNLSVLESLDLSSNKLNGEIPGELTGLTFLALLDISNNELSGPIPRGKQFNTFQNSSFLGNENLCGSPLSKKCDRDETISNSSQPVQDEDEDSESSNWIGIIVGYVCGLVFGVFMCNLLISGAKAKQIFSSMEDSWYSYKWSFPFHRSRR